MLLRLATVVHSGLDEQKRRHILFRRDEARKTSARNIAGILVVRHLKTTENLFDNPPAVGRDDGRGAVHERNRSFGKLMAFRA
jgi:hypothetical protein